MIIQEKNILFTFKVKTKRLDYNTNKQEMKIIQKLLKY